MRDASGYTPTLGMLQALIDPAAADTLDVARCRRRGLLDRRDELTEAAGDLLAEIARRRHGL